MRSIFLGFCGVVVVAAAAWRTATEARRASRDDLRKLARSMGKELYALQRVTLEMKRRMSTARVGPAEPGLDQRPRVSFAEGGDPEGYGKAVEQFCGEPTEQQIQEWLSGDVVV